MDRARRILSGGWLARAVSALTRGFFAGGDTGDFVDFSSVAEVSSVLLTGVAGASNIISSSTSLSMDGEAEAFELNASIMSPSLTAPLEV